jgi:tight adherence protein B
LTPTLVTALTFLAVALAVASAYSIAVDLFLRDRVRVSQRLDDEFSNRTGLAARRSPLFKNLDKFGPDPLGLAQARSSIRGRFENMIYQSGLGLTPGRLLTIALVAAAIVGGSVGLVSRSPLGGGVFFIVGFAAPILYVRFVRNRRLEKMMKQLPDAFELIARLVRAGQTTSQAFQGVADEFDDPVSAEFEHCYEQQNLGLAPEVAMRDMARRTDLVEMKIFILAVLVQRQTGGNLAELIDNLASLVRERFRIRGKIQVLTAEGRMEAAVLMALPPIVFFMIFSLNRNYAEILLEHPNLLWGMAGFMLIGVLWIRKIINFDF